MVSKLFRDMWCKAVIDKAVKYFHAERGEERDEEKLGLIARTCANRAFQESAHTIDRNAVSAHFTELYVARFTKEICDVLKDGEELAA